MSSLTTLPLADYWGMHDGDIGLGWGLVMIFGMLIFWGLVAAGIVWLVRSGRSSASDRSDDPLDTLDHSLADGRMSLEEYERRRAVLTGSGHRDDG